MESNSAADAGIAGLTPSIGHGMPWLQSRWGSFLSAVLIVLAGWAAYGNSFSGPFIYDDFPSIVGNATIRRWWLLPEVLWPPCHGGTVSGRPLLNLSLAINYAFSGERTWSYHATNLAIHMVAALLLWGILRRTFQLPVVKPRFGAAGPALSLAITLLWTVHPLQTESVTYMVQRAESLAGLFYLLTLYSLIRAAWSKRAVGWYSVGVASCWLGAGTKEILATAPVVVLLYDRTFLTGSFRESMRRRWGFYAGLAASWGLLAGLVISRELGTHDEHAATSIGWSYALSQPGVILYYLRLSVWPHPLCLDYAWPAADTLGTVLPALVCVSALGVATIWGLTGGRRWGFVGAWFFLILAPSSSIIRLEQLAFEHRMYLSLAGSLTLLVAGGYVAGQGLVRHGWITGRALTFAGMVAITAAVVVLGCLTFRRNEVYHDGKAIWQDALAKSPRSSRSCVNLGNALLVEGRSDEALAYYERAVQIDPDLVEPRNNLGFALAQRRRFGEAIEHYRAALRVRPDSVAVRNNLAAALAGSGRPLEAIEHYEHAIRVAPRDADAYQGLANTLGELGRTEEAIQRCRQAAENKPESAEILASWAKILLLAGRSSEAMEKCEQALRIQPDSVELRCNLATALGNLGRQAEAIEQYEQAARMDPKFAPLHFNWGNLLLSAGRISEAVEHFGEALRIQPDLVQARYSLVSGLAQAGRHREAIEHGKQLVRLMPGQPDVLRFVAWLMATHEPGGDNAKQAVELAERASNLTDRRDIACLEALAAAYASAGRFDDAVTTADEARRLAEAAGQKSLAEEIHMHLQLYRDHKPYRETGGAGSKEPVQE